jgi:hypothetical protein
MVMFGHQSSVFTHSPRLVQTLAIIYDEIFQALTIKGDDLLPKPFLHLGFDGVSDGNRQPRIFFFFGQTRESPRGPHLKKISNFTF